MLSINIITLSAILLIALLSRPALADDSMSQGEIDEMVDDLGGGDNRTTDSGMNGNTTTASTGPVFTDSEPANDFSSRAAELDEDKDEDSGVDKEIGESGGVTDAMYDHYSGTPEPEGDVNRTTMIPSGDSYNAPFEKKAKKKKVVKKSKKSKHKVAKKSKKSKKNIAKSKKKSKERRIAGRKSSSKKRVR